MSIFEQLILYGPIQWIALLTGILYVFFAARNQAICWIFGIISSACIGFVDLFTEVALYSDALLQFVYIVLGIYGIWQWIIRRDDKEEKLKISSKKVLWHVIYILIFSLLSYPFGLTMRYFFGGVFPLIDAWTTILSIWATVLLARRIFEHWIYWIVLDIIYIFLYYSRDVPLFSILFIIYTLVSFYGFFRWSKLKSEKLI